MNRFLFPVFIVLTLSSWPAVAQTKLAADCQAGDQQACVQLARSNAASEMRVAAVRKLTDQSVLLEVAQKCEVRTIRLAAIRGLIDQDRLETVARSAQGAVERGTAIERVKSQEVLAQIARKDTSKWVRRKAANCLTDEGQIAMLVAEDRKELLPTITFGGGIRHVAVDGKPVKETLLGVITLLPGRHSLTADFIVKENVVWEDASVTATTLDSRLGADYFLEAEVLIVTWDYIAPQTRRGSGTWKLVVHEEVAPGPGLLPQLLRR
jgi:hypothetical protein